MCDNVAGTPHRHLKGAMVLSQQLSEAIDSYVEADVITDDLKADARLTSKLDRTSVKVTFEKVLEALNAKKTELLDIVVHLEKAPLRDLIILI